MKKSIFRRIVYSLLATILMVYFGGLFITFNPNWIVTAEAFGRTMVLLISFFVFILLATCPFYDDDYWS